METVKCLYNNGHHRWSNWVLLKRSYAPDMSVAVLTHEHTCRDCNYTEINLQKAILK